jgi:hypothetical protein
MFITVVCAAIKQGFNQRMTEVKITDLNLAKEVADADGKNKRYKEVMEMFGDETVANCLSTIEGMPGAIDSFIKEEMTGRELATLKTDFL